MSRQILIPAEVAATLPKLYAQEKVADPIVHVKLFTPYGGWTWLLTEYDPKTGRAFGFCYDAAFPAGAELGYVDVGYLQGQVVQSGPLKGLQAVQRDVHFGPKPLSRAKAQECDMDDSDIRAGDFADETAGLAASAAD